MSVTAEIALAAGLVVRLTHNSVTCRKAGHLTANLNYLTGKLMSENNRRIVSKLIVYYMYIRSADTATARLR